MTTGRQSQQQAALRVSILIVSYNTREMTLACLRSVVEQTTAGTYEIIVVDNQSKDGSAEAIAAEFPGMRLIRSQENLGFAKANNVAAKEAGSEYLLLLNPDTVVLDRAIDRLLAFAKVRPEAGIWGGRTLFADRTLNPASCWGRQTLWSVFCFASGLSALFRHSEWFDPEGYGGWDRGCVREVDIVSGCFLLIQRSKWEALGGFDPAFFMYGEEADLCLRARRLGARPMVTPEATIIHYGGASERVRSDKMARLLNAKVRLIRCHWPHSLVKVGVGLLSLWPLSRWVAWSCLIPIRGSSAKVSAKSWGDIWRRRAEWRAA
jgi:GT2 family glycosyltransferase